MPHILTTLAQSAKETFIRHYRGASNSVSTRARRPLSAKPYPLLALTLTLAASATLSAESLETENPFLPPGYGEKKPEAPKVVVQKNGPISREVEFRGVVKLNGTYQFSIFNKSEQKSYWISENQAENGISVSNYDDETRAITVNMNGRSERLTLMSASAAPLPVVSSINQPNNSKTSKPTLPPNLQPSQNGNSNERRRVVPRRRVILPKK